MAILAGGLLGALLLLVAEFTTLFEVSDGRAGPPVKSVGTGSHHAYALVPIALLAAALAYGVWRVGSRPALLSIGLLAVIALLIGLLGDLPDAHASGLLTNTGGRYVSASSSPERRAVHGDARRRGAADHLRLRIPPARAAAPPGAARCECPHPDSRRPPSATSPAGRYIPQTRGLSHRSPRSRVVGGPRVLPQRPCDHGPGCSSEHVARPRLTPGAVYQR